jgi:hypothetical protein
MRILLRGSVYCCITFLIQIWCIPLSFLLAYNFAGRKESDEVLERDNIKAGC